MDFEEAVHKLRNSRSERVRDAAAIALRDLELPEGVEPLVEAVRRAAPGSQATLLWALEPFQTREHIALYVWLLTDPSFLVRQQALQLIDLNADDDATIERCRVVLRQLLTVVPDPSEEALELKRALKVTMHPDLHAALGKAVNALLVKRVGSNPEPLSKGVTKRPRRDRKVAFGSDGLPRAAA